jgi:hypothetical protein
MNSSEPNKWVSDSITHQPGSPSDNGDNGGAALAPIANGGNGRDRLGRFGRGNPSCTTASVPPPLVPIRRR